MKRLLSGVCTLTIIACSVEPMVAQKITDMGMKAGIDLARLDVDNSDVKVGFIGGAFLTYSISDMLSIQPEILFVMKGGKFVEEISLPPPFGVMDTHYDLRLNYLEIPVLIKFNLLMGESFKPSIFAGGYFAIEAGGTAAVEFAGSKAEQSIDPFKYTDCGLIFGAGVDMRLGTVKLTVDVRYDLGLRDAFTVNTTLNDIQKIRQVKTRSASIVIGYSFN